MLTSNGAKNIISRSNWSNNRLFGGEFGGRPYPITSKTRVANSVKVVWLLNVYFLGVSDEREGLREALMRKKSEREKQNIRKKKLRDWRKKEKEKWRENEMACRESNWCLTLTVGLWVCLPSNRIGFFMLISKKRVLE